MGHRGQEFVLGTVRGLRLGSSGALGVERALQGDPMLANGASRGLERKRQGFGLSRAGRRGRRPRNLAGVLSIRTFSRSGMRSYCCPDRRVALLVSHRRVDVRSSAAARNSTGWDCRCRSRSGSTPDRRSTGSFAQESVTIEETIGRSTSASDPTRAWAVWSRPAPITSTSTPTPLPPPSSASPSRRSRSGRSVLFAFVSRPTARFPPRPARRGQITPSRFISATAWAVSPSQSLSTWSVCSPSMGDDVTRVAFPSTRTGQPGILNGRCTG